MPITRRYSPPFQAPAPKPGADDMGRAIKGLVSVEIQRTSEVSFAVESFGCDGKPVLSFLRGLPCETSGTLAVAGTKNGMPFKLGAELPRGLGSAIRGSGGSLRQVSSSTAMRSAEWVIYDNFGNYWSLDELTGFAPTYRGETPPEVGGDGTTPALCTQDPWIRPYELRTEYIGGTGDPVVYQVWYRWGGAGWIEDDSASPVVTYPVAEPYELPDNYSIIDQWIPDETTPPAGGEMAGGWPGMKRHVDIGWSLTHPTPPHDWDSYTENSVDVIVSKYPASAPWRVYMNRTERPLIEHISTGGAASEMGLIIAVEKKLWPGLTTSAIVLRGRNSGTLIGTLGISSIARSDARHMFTPWRDEGWVFQTGAVVGDVVTLKKYWSRTSTANNFGTALSFKGNVAITLPSGAAHPWTSEPVWFRVGRVRKLYGTAARLTPLLPRWR